MTGAELIKKLQTRSAPGDELAAALSAFNGDSGGVMRTPGETAADLTRRWGYAMAGDIASVSSLVPGEVNGMGSHAYWRSAKEEINRLWKEAEKEKKNELTERAE